MTREDNIIVPRWFLEVIENTLRIQNNINLDKKTGETCQDRNIRQSLNGIRKLLNEEELTGMERLEKIQPSLPTNLDEVAERYGTEKHPMTTTGANESAYDFKEGAEWLAEQGYIQEEIVEDKAIESGYGVLPGISPIINLPDSFKPGDKVIIQIRKKQ